MMGRDGVAQLDHDQRFLQKATTRLPVPWCQISDLLACCPRTTKIGEIQERLGSIRAQYKQRLPACASQESARQMFLVDATSKELPLQGALGNRMKTVRIALLAEKRVKLQNLCEAQGRDALIDCCHGFDPFNHEICEGRIRGSRYRCQLVLDPCAAVFGCPLSSKIAYLLLTRTHTACTGWCSGLF